MANLQEIKLRIASVQSTKQITSAMKMVSAAKLRKAQQAITEMKPYAEKLQDILRNISTGLDGENKVYSEQRSIQKALIVAIASNSSLCGAFNANVYKRVNALIEEKYKGKEVKVLSIGKKVSEHFAKTSYAYIPPALKMNPNLLYDNLTFAETEKVSSELIHIFKSRLFDEIHIVYNGFKNAATQVVTVEQLLPVLPEKNEGEKKGFVQDFIFEPSKEKILSDLIPKALKTQFFKAMLDSYASEHGARMTAMHKASDNATSLLGDLNLTYNKARQAAITNEILEIVSGAEALNG